MPVRSINLKMLVDRSSAGDLSRQQLWTTHETINTAVRTVERYLLLMRGERYRTDDDAFEEQDEVRAEALRLAREAQNQNGKANTGKDEALLASMRKLYEALVPSCCLDDKGEPLKGSAQASREFAGPLMTPDSQGLQDIFEKIVDPLPAWVDKMEADLKERKKLKSEFDKLQKETPQNLHDTDFESWLAENPDKYLASSWEEESTEWVKSEQSQNLLGRTGRKLTWIKALENSRPWQKDFVKDQEKKRKNFPKSQLVREMQAELGLLPLFRPPITSQIADPDGLAKWDYLVLRLAVGHLLSWESWNHRTANPDPRYGDERAIAACG